MKVSVVIPLYNREKSIIPCLESLIRQTYPVHEIIVVDNNSSDNSYSIVEAFIEKHKDNKIILLKEVVPGPSAARNKGITQATGDIIAFTDSDCIADRNWIKEIVEAYDESIGGVAGNIKGYMPKNLVEKFLSIFTLRGLKTSQIFKQYTLLEGGFPSANLSFRREVLEQLNGFEVTIRYGEDHDICARAYKLGYKIKYITKGLIYHCHRSSLVGLIKQSFGFGQAHSCLLRRHFKKIMLLELPKFTVQNSCLPCRIRLDFASADKKLIFLIVLGFIHPLIFSLSLIYIIYLTIYTRKKAAKIGIKTSLIENIGMSFLLIIKSFSMTFGRIYGSFKYKVICF